MGVNMTSAPEDLSTPRGRLRAERIRQGLSLRELSLKAGLSHAALAYIEKGERQNFGIDAASKIAAALGLNLDWMINGIGQRFRSDEKRACAATLELPRESST